MSANARLVRFAAASTFAILSFSATVAFAQDYMTESKMQTMSTHAVNNEHADHASYDRSGTRGREGLGASSARPEGPGDFAD
ncbi:hypothetical protein [Methylocella sp.]|uniref:hypothetical protein n=1 Tax=Methylocella sp. TaxID=1978226 RepID=UPI003784A776